MNGGKLIATTVVGVGLYAGYTYYLRMKKTQAELQVIPEAKLHSVNWDGITIQLDFLLKNPTSGSLAIKFPFIKLLYKSSLVGSSQVVNQNINIPAYGQAKVDKILVNIPILSIFSVSSSILKAVQSKEEVKITATMITTIDIGLTQIPYEESHEVILKKK